MKLYSEVLDKEFEVELYEVGEGKWCVKDICLVDILINKMPEGRGVNYDNLVISASPDYAAVRCTITDTTGRKIQAFSETNVKFLEEKDDFAKKLPLVSASNAAAASAVKGYLGWPKYIIDESYSTTVISAEDDAVTDASIDELSPEDISPETLASVNEELGGEEAKEESAIPAEPRRPSQMSLEELANETITFGTYEGKTLAEMWELKPAWFTFVEKYKDEKYACAKEYLKRKNESKEGKSEHS